MSEEKASCSELEKFQWLLSSSSEVSSSIVVVPLILEHLCEVAGTTVPILKMEI